MSKPGEAVMALTRLGFRLWLEGEYVKVRHEGSEAFDPAMVRPLLAIVKAHKEEVRRYLAHAQGNISNQPERILTCAECPWFQQNPWTHYPDLPAWCGWHFDHLATDNPICIGYRKGEIPAPT